MLKTKILFLLIICFAMCGAAFAWDDIGHKTVAYIAWQKMTPKAREQVIKILRGAPEDSNLAAYFMSDARSLPIREMDYFMLSATWADIVRDREFKVRYKNYHHGPWHYSDTFWRDGTDGKPSIVSGMEAGGEAVEKLFAFDKSLRDAKVSDEDKAIALAWVLHLVGDIHQPLHTSGRITETEPKGDQGGNLFLITPQGTARDKSDNLHWYWDSIIVRNIPRGETGDIDFVSRIAKDFMKKYPESKFSNRLDLGKFDSWQQEGFRIATSELFPATLKRFEMPSNKYKNNALKISEQQIALAGYRLGAMLNNIFGGAQTTAQVSAPNDKCYAIRKILYPVTKRTSKKYPQKQEICLLDLCPPNRGKVARPTIDSVENGKTVWHEFDVVKVFKNETEAKEFARKNNVGNPAF